LQQAKATAKRVQCLSNVKQLGVFGLCWSHDNEGWILPGTWRDKLKDQGFDNAAHNTCPASTDANGYGLNANFYNPIPFMAPLWGGSGDPWFWNQGRFRANLVKAPQDLIMFMDASAYYGAFWQNSPFLYQLYANTRHAQGAAVGSANIVFLDGHAELKQDGYIKTACGTAVGAMGTSGCTVGYGGKWFRVW
jgi:prepilin-type processing-associated H-X9-DG protein